MQLHYTPEEVRDLVAEGACLNYPAPTMRDVAEATDVLEGVEELIAKLPAGDRFTTLSGIAADVEGALWVPVAHNCRLSVGVVIEERGDLTFGVRGEGGSPISYVAARRAAIHALLIRADTHDADLPAPEENGASLILGSTGAFLESPEEDRSRAESHIEPVEPDETFLGTEFDRTEGAVDFVLKGIAGDAPSDLAIEGLDHPGNISISYLGLPRGGVRDVASDESNGKGAGRGAQTLHPDWRARLGELQSEGELPKDVLEDASILVEEVEGKDDSIRPGAFLAELSRRRGAASLKEEDLDTEERAHRLGAMDPDSVEPESIARLASAGKAHLRMAGSSGELFLVPAGILEERVTEAAERSLIDAAEKRERERERQILHALNALFESGRALSLEAVLGRIGGSSHKDFLRSQVRGARLEARRIGGEVVLASVGAPESEFRRAARLAGRVRVEAPSNRRTAARRARRRGARKAFAAPVVPFGDEANHLPPEPEREYGPDPEGTVGGRSYLNAERSGEAVIGTYGRGVPDSSRTPRQRAAARRRVALAVARGKARRTVESEAKNRDESLSCKGAWKKALKIHLASLPPKERLELFLKIEGRQEFDALESRASDPDALERSARGLVEDGRIKVCGRSSGKLFIEAVGSLDHSEKTRLGQELIEVMALTEPGRIGIPENTRLARRVAVVRKALEKTKTGVGTA